MFWVVFHFALLFWTRLVMYFEHYILFISSMNKFVSSSFFFFKPFYRRNIIPQLERKRQGPVMASILCRLSGLIPNH